MTVSLDYCPPSWRGTMKVNVSRACRAILPSCHGILGFVNHVVFCTSTRLWTFRSKWCQRKHWGNHQLGNFFVVSCSFLSSFFTLLITRCLRKTVTGAIKPEPLTIFSIRARRKESDRNQRFKFWLCISFSTSQWITSVTILFTNEKEKSLMPSVAKQDPVVKMRRVPSTGFLDMFLILSDFQRLILVQPGWLTSALPYLFWWNETVRLRA